jgi:curved DNA-binding protein CbpA
MQDSFVDYYELMQISRNAEPDTIHRVYRMLATKLHPDNRHTGDLDGFIALNQAYEVLSDPKSRSMYDAEHSARAVQPLEVFSTSDFAVGLEGESNRRLGILSLLYARRRADVDNPGLSLLELEALMGTPREHLLFATWYLREKQHVRLDDRSNLLITAEGVDYVEQNLPSNRVLYRLLRPCSSAESSQPVGMDESAARA